MALRDAATLRRLNEAGVDAYADNSPEAAARHLSAEVAKWGGLVQELGLQLELEPGLGLVLPPGAHRLPVDAD